MPSSSQAGSLVFKVVRANLLDDSPVPVELESLPKVVLWMPSMGHGSTPTQVRLSDIGSFEVNNVFFIMPGDWELRFQIQLPEGGGDEAVIRLNI